MAKSNSIFDDWKLRLTTKPLASGAKPPMFAVSIFNKNPQFTVYPNHDNGSGVTFIPASMDAKTFFMIMQMIDYLADRVIAEGNISPVKYKWDNKTQIPREQRSDPKVSMKVVSESWVGVDEKGVWISVKDANNAQAPLIQFHFGTDYYHPLSGKDLQEQWKSAQAAKGWTAMNRGLMINVLDRAGAKEPEGGNQGGGYQKNNNYGNKGGNKSYSNGGGNKSYGNNGGGNQSYGSGGNGGGSGFDDVDEFDDGDFA